MGFWVKIVFADLAIRLLDTSKTATIIIELIIGNLIIEEI